MPAGQGESDWWSLDHLFLDQDGTPTFVECKRSSDTRGRREVVAQMLDYAANGTSYWTMDRLRQLATESADKEGRDLDTSIRRLTGAVDGDDVEPFWQTVEEKLRRGQVRLIFVTDHAPRELLRLTEFLNEQMRDTEVLLLEIKRFRADSGHQALVPRLLGRSERSRPPGPQQKATDRDAFLAKCSPDVRQFFGRVLQEAVEHGYVVQWGTVGFSIRRLPPGSAKLSSFVYCYPPNQFEFYFGGSLEPATATATALRADLLKADFLSQAGERTLRARVSGDQIEKAVRTWQAILLGISDLQRAAPPAAQ